MYLILISAIILFLLPTNRRKLIQTAWLNALLRALDGLVNDANYWFNNAIYRSYFTGQVIYLEKLLNDLFPAALGGIYISDSIELERPVVFNKIENRPTAVIRNKSESPSEFIVRNKFEFISNYQFIVYIPSSITLTPDTINLIRGYVDKYRQAGVTYNLVSY